MLELLLLCLKTVTQTTEFSQLKGNNLWAGGNQDVGEKRSFASSRLLLTDSNRKARAGQLPGPWQAACAPGMPGSTFVTGCKEQVKSRSEHYLSGTTGELCF